MRLSKLMPVLLCTLIVISYFHVFLDDETKQFLLEEDGLIENIGAIAFLIASLLFLYSFFTRKQQARAVE